MSFTGRVVSPPPNPQAGGPPTVRCPRLLMQYIHSYPPYLEAVSSICNLRMRHAMVTVDPLNMVTLSIMVINRTNIVKSLRVTFGVVTPDKVEMWSTK
jgi:hypothetical protein